MKKVLLTILLICGISINYCYSCEVTFDSNGYMGICTSSSNLSQALVVTGNITSTGTVTANIYEGNGSHLTGIVSGGAGVVGSTFSLVNLIGGTFLIPSVGGAYNTKDEFLIGSTSETISVTVFPDKIKSMVQQIIPIDDYYDCTNGIILYINWYSTNSGNAIFNIGISSDDVNVSYTWYSSTQIQTGVFVPIGGSANRVSVSSQIINIPFTSFTNNCQGKIEIMRLGDSADDTLAGSVYWKLGKPLAKRRY